MAEASIIFSPCRWVVSARFHVLSVMIQFWIFSCTDCHASWGTEFRTGCQTAELIVGPWPLGLSAVFEALFGGLQVIQKLLYFPALLSVAVHCPQKGLGQLRSTVLQPLFWWFFFSEAGSISLRVLTSGASLVLKGMSRRVNFDNGQWVWKHLIIHIRWLKIYCVAVRYQRCVFQFHFWLVQNIFHTMNQVYITKFPMRKDSRCK